MSEHKKQQFKQPPKSKLPLIVALVAVILIGGFVYDAYRDKLQGSETTAPTLLGEPAAAPRSYIGERVTMTDIEPVVENRQIRFPLAVVDDNGIVYFELENDEGTLVPLMAYITPTGRLFAGSSMCEPCNGRRFSLAGETLVCETCGTTYTIEDRVFISGAQACGQYPPVDMKPLIEDGMIVIDYNEVLQWRSRV